MAMLQQKGRQYYAYRLEPDARKERRLDFIRYFFSAIFGKTDFDSPALKYT